MIFPEYISTEEMPLRVKEWELLGFDVTSGHAFVSSVSYTSIYKPLPDTEHRKNVHRSWVSYWLEYGRWQRYGIPPDELPQSHTP